MKAIKHNQVLSTGGDGSGTSDFIGSYDVVPVEGLLIAPTGYTYNVHRLIVSVGDANGMTGAEYGNLGAALTNGIALKVETRAGATEISDLMSGHSVKTNGEWGALCYDVDIKGWGVGVDLLVARFSFNRFGSPITLRGDDQMSIVFSDDFAGLDSHHFNFQGEIS